MALYKPSEFAELCGISTDSVYVYKTRGKIVVKDGYIDDADPINDSFREQKLSKKGLKPEKKILEKQKNAAKPEQHKKEKNEQPKKALTKEQKEPDFDRSSSDIVLLNAKKTAQQIKKLEAEVQKLQIDISKRSAELLPVQLVENIIVMQSESAKIAFTEACESLLVTLTQKKGYTREEQTELRSKLIKIVNTAITNAYNLGMKQKSNILKEFSDKKEVGEHD